MSLEYAIDVSKQLEAIRERLGELQSQAEPVLRRAVRQTGNAVRKSMLEAARARYAEQDASMLSNKALKVSAKGDGMTVTLRARGRPTDLSKFEYQPTPGIRAPVSAHVLAANALKEIHGGKDKSGKEMPEPFVVVLNSGHIGIMRRVPGETYAYGKKYMARKLLGWDLTRVEQLKSVPVPKMFDNDEVIDEARQQFNDLLPAMIEKQIASAIRKGAKK